MSESRILFNLTKKKKMKVLSLFDGISCGMVALERAGIEVERYDAYEIEKSAIAISKKNYPNILSLWKCLRCRLFKIQ